MTCCLIIFQKHFERNKKKSPITHASTKWAKWDGLACEAQQRLTFVFFLYFFI
jgi:hypothetical protein